MFEACDVNYDGRIDFNDINPFVAILSGGGGWAGQAWLGPGTTCNDCCWVPAPPAGTFTWEGERLGMSSLPDHYNGGCNSVPPVFQPLACGHTLRGRAGIYGQQPDSDWFTTTLAAPQRLHASVDAEFKAEFWILRAGVGPNRCDPNDPNGYVVLAHSQVPRCTPVELVTDGQAAGEYWVVVALRETTSTFAVSNYNLVLTCEPCPLDGGSTGGPGLERVPLPTDPRPPLASDGAAGSRCPLER